MQEKIDVNGRFLNKIKPEFLFVILYFVTALYGTVYMSVWNVLSYKSLTYYLPVLIILFCICLFFNIFIYKTYNYKKFMTHLFFTLLIYVIAKTTNIYNIFYMWLFLISIPPVSFQKISKIALSVLVPLFVTVILLTAFGFGDNIQFYRFENIYFSRSSYGFIDPNMFSAYFFQICLALVYIRWKNFGVKDNLFLFAGFCLVFFFANSRTISVLLILLLIFVNYCRFWQEKYVLKDMNFLANSALIFCPVFSFFMSYMYCQGSRFALRLDEILSCRLRNLCYCMNSYPVNLFGNKYLIKQDMDVLANFYGILLIKNGIIVFVLFLAGYLLMIRKIYLMRNLPLLIILFLTLIQAVSEGYMLIHPLDFGLLAFSCLLNNYKL